MRESLRFWVISGASFSHYAWVTMCHLSLIPLCRFHEMDDVKDSERERLNSKQMDKDRERYLEYRCKLRDIRAYVQDREYLREGRSV